MDLVYPRVNLRHGYHGHMTHFMRTKEAFKFTFGDVEGEIRDVGGVRGMGGQREIFSRGRKRSIS
jgi:hypothetical protein